MYLQLPRKIFVPQITGAAFFLKYKEENWSAAFSGYVWFPKAKTDQQLPISLLN